MLKNPWIILIIVVALMGSHTVAYFKGDAAGYDRYADEQSEAEDEAETGAIENVQKVKTETKVIYKYIREQDNDCSIYDRVIERMREPQGSRRQ